MSFNGKTGFHRLHGSIGLHLGRIEIQILAPDQFGLLTLFDDGLEEATKHREAITGADLAEGGMIWE